jgi:hypothetical protein
MRERRSVADRKEMVNERKKECGGQERNGK